MKIVLHSPMADAKCCRVASDAKSVRKTVVVIGIAAAAVKRVQKCGRIFGRCFSPLQPGMIGVKMDVCLSSFLT